MTEFNTDLAITVLARIEEAQKHTPILNLPGWKQGYWGFIPKPGAEEDVPMESIVDDHGNIIGVGTCNTAYCFAGHALTVEGIKMEWYDHGDFLSCDRTTDGEEVWAAGARLLRIDGEQAKDEGLWDGEDNMPALFSAGNTLGDLYRIVAAHSGLDEAVLQDRVETRVAQMEASLEKGGQTK